MYGFVFMFVSDETTYFAASENHRATCSYQAQSSLGAGRCWSLSACPAGFDRRLFGGAKLGISSQCKPGRSSVGMHDVIMIIIGRVVPFQEWFFDGGTSMVPSSVWTLVPSMQAVWMIQKVDLTHYAHQTWLLTKMPMSRPWGDSEFEHIWAFIITHIGLLFCLPSNFKNELSNWNAKPQSTHFVSQYRNISTQITIGSCLRPILWSKNRQ